eukprot:2668161-Pyramimonas_sp.AAC.2
MMSDDERRPTTDDWVATDWAALVNAYHQHSTSIALAYRDASTAVDDATTTTDAATGLLNTTTSLGEGQDSTNTIPPIITPPMATTTVTAGIVTTVRGMGQTLTSWVQYHLAVGFSKLYIYFDDPSEKAQLLAECPQMNWALSSSAAHYLASRITFIEATKVVERPVITTTGNIA